MRLMAWAPASAQIPKNNGESNGNEMKHEMKTGVTYLCGLKDLRRLHVNLEVVVTRVALLL